MINVSYYSAYYGIILNVYILLYNIIYVILSVHTKYDQANDIMTGGFYPITSIQPQQLTAVAIRHKYYS